MLWGGIVVCKRKDGVAKNHVLVAYQGAPCELNVGPILLRVNLLLLFSSATQPF